MTIEQLSQKAQTYKQMKRFKTIGQNIKNNADELVDVCISTGLRIWGFYIEVRKNGKAIAFIKVGLVDRERLVSRNRVVDVLVDELWVDANERRKGHATILFKYLLKELEDKANTRCRIRPIIYRSLYGRLITGDKIQGNWNKSLPFYKSLPSKNLSDKYCLGECVFYGNNTAYKSGSDFVENCDNGQFEYKISENNFKQY